MLDGCAPAKGTFWQRPLFPALLAAIAAMVSSWGLRYGSLDDTGRLFLALLVMPPSIYFVRSMQRYVRGLDELQQRIQGEALAIAFSGGMVLVLGLEYLQKAGFARNLDWDFAWGAMAGMYLASWYFVSRRYV
jgi:hypothetical protein